MSEPPLLCGKPPPDEGNRNPPPTNFNLFTRLPVPLPSPHPQPVPCPSPQSLTNSRDFTTAPSSQPAQPVQPPTTAPNPPSLPRKPPGRPKGRVNKTLESDYLANPHVQLWNTSQSPVSLPATGINIRLALPESILIQPTQRTIFQLPSREVIYFVQGSITARHIASKRPSYVNALLIHSRGRDSEEMCAQCRGKWGQGGMTPFLECRAIKGVFGEACSNCKWYDGASGCSLFTGPTPNRKRKGRDGGKGTGERIMVELLADGGDGGVGGTRKE